MASNIKQVQKKILEIAVYFDEFCKKEGISYYLMGGSALGAVRHGGFIPWDDDLDVFMTYDNYQKLISVCENKLDREHFYFQCENTEELPILFSKIRMNGTTFIEEGTLNRRMHKGIFLDIMCLNETPSNRLHRFIHYMAARLVSTKALIRYGYKTDRILKKVAMKITGVLISDHTFDVLLKYVRSFNGTGKEYVGHFFGRAKFKNTSFKKELLGKPRYIKFEDTYLPVPERVEEYLEIRFGKNYMKIPDNHVRKKYPVHAIYASIEKDYREYEAERDERVYD